LAVSPDGQRIATGDADGLVWLYDAPRSLASYRRELASVERDAARQARWHAQRAEEATGARRHYAEIFHLTRLIAYQPQDARWPAQRAGAYLRRDQTTEALADLATAIRLDPKEAELYWIRGSLLTALGEHKKARGDFRQFAERTPAGSVGWCLYALNALARNDMLEYRKTCATLLKRYRDTKQPEYAEVVALTCVLAPQATKDPDRVVKLARLVTEAHEGAGTNRSGSVYHSYHTLLGAALYRAGKSEEAVKQLDGAVQQDRKTGTEMDWLFLAMAHHRLKHPVEAKKWLKKAVQSLQKQPDQSGTMDRLAQLMQEPMHAPLLQLRREAEALLGEKKP
jgi:tetratricopeptide (TPR) repeat protein